MPASDAASTASGRRGADSGNKSDPSHHGFLYQFKTCTTAEEQYAFI